MNYKEFIQKYEELLNSGYCECNELNCLDNNPPKKILNIMKEQQQEIERLNNIINELEKHLEKIIIDGGTRGSMTFWYRQIYDYLQELKGSDSNVKD